MATYFAGQRVALKSGGPRMTVTGETDTCGYVRCIWFGKQDEIGEFWFPVCVLDPVAEEDQETEEGCRPVMPF